MSWLPNALSGVLVARSLVLLAPPNGLLLLAPMAALLTPNMPDCVGCGGAACPNGLLAEDELGAPKLKPPVCGALEAGVPNWNPSAGWLVPEAAVEEVAVGADVIEGVPNETDGLADAGADVDGSDEDPKPPNDGTACEGEAALLVPKLKAGLLVSVLLSDEPKLSPPEGDFAPAGAPNEKDGAPPPKLAPFFRGPSLLLSSLFSSFPRFLLSAFVDAWPKPPPKAGIAGPLLCCGAPNEKAGFDVLSVLALAVVPNPSKVGEAVDEGALPKEKEGPLDMAVADPLLDSAVVPSTLPAPPNEKETLLASLAFASLSLLLALNDRLAPDIEPVLLVSLLSRDPNENDLLVGASAFAGWPKA